MRKITIKSHCKINLGLNIIRKRSDGFHDIETIFYPVGLHDVISFEPASQFSFTTDSDELSGNIEQNLIVKAVRALEGQCKQQFNIAVNLQKNIPMGAGLGGGSSNAAVTLLSLNEIYHLGLSAQQLATHALALGSDVPYFLKLQPAYAASRGEALRYIDFEIPLHLVLVNPGIHVSTKWAYENIVPAIPEFRIETLLGGDMSDIDRMRAVLTNDFEQPVFRQYPEIRSIKEQMLKGGASLALMSGSGSSVFGFFKDLENAEKIRSDFQNNCFTYLEPFENC